MTLIDELKAFKSKRQKDYQEMIARREDRKYFDMQSRKAMFSTWSSVGSVAPLYKTNIR